MVLPGRRKARRAQPAEASREQEPAIAPTALRIVFGADEVVCALGACEVGLLIVDGFRGAARLLGFQQHHWSPTLTVVATDAWARDDAERDRVAAERMLAVFELDDGSIIQYGDPVQVVGPPARR